MILLLVAVVALLVIAALVFAVIIWRRRGVPQTPPPIQAEPETMVDREETEATGTALLERRVQLDARRGALQGDAGIDREFDRLLDRLRAGEITEEQFEQEKRRLLGG